MKVVILGAGTVGFQLAKELIDEKVSVVIIERDAMRAQLVGERLDCLVITDNGATLPIFRAAGIEEADFFVSVTDSDEMNIIACSMVNNEFKKPKKVARVRNLEYSEHNVLDYRVLGIDYVVNPEVTASNAVMRSVNAGAMSDVFTFEHSNLEIRSLIITRDSSWIGQTISNISHTIHLPFLIAIIIRNNKIVIPSGKTTVLEGDIAYITSDSNTFDYIYRQIGFSTKRLQSFIIVGGGRVGEQLITTLSGITNKSRSITKKILSHIKRQHKRDIVVIEKCKEKCRYLSQQFSNILILNADVTDERLFQEENLHKADLLIAATDNEELNIVTTIYAKTIGIKRSVALVSRESYTNIANRIGIDVVINVKNSVANAILKNIRYGSIGSIYSIFDNNIEISEFSIGNDSNVLGKEIRQIAFPLHTLIVSIRRQDQDILPKGKDKLQRGDTIIVIALKESVSQIKTIFALDK